jgi:hypothetical protein
MWSRTPGGCCLTYKFTHKRSPARLFCAYLEIIPCKFLTDEKELLPQEDKIWAEDTLRFFSI